jgi:hypothetical protein
VLNSLGRIRKPWTPYTLRVWTVLQKMHIGAFLLSLFVHFQACAPFVSACIVWASLLTSRYFQLGWLAP